MSVNDDILHETIRHAIDLQRFNNGTVLRLIAGLNKAAARIAAELLVKLPQLDPESFSVQRLEALLVDARRLSNEAYARLADELVDEVRDLNKYEIGYQYELFRSTIPPQVLVELPLASINPEQVLAASLARPFQGVLLREWAAQQDAASMNRVRATIRQGFVEQKTTQQIVADVRGTRAASYEDGVLAVDRRQAEAVVRTALSHTAGYARDTFLAENDQLVKEVQWISTLDSRTSPPCILRDRKLFSNPEHKPLGHTYPWGAGPGRFHWNCRSTSVPIVKSFRELGIDLDEFSASTRASMDGQVPEDTSYAGWLRKQSAERQDDILGATRGKLFRDGGLEIDKFANRKGDWLSLDELRERDAAAFRKAGV